MSTIALLNPIFKDDYKEYNEQLNNASWVLENLKARNKPREFSGQRAVHTIHTKRNSGVGSRADNGTLPVAGNQTTQKIMLPMRRHYARIFITGPAMKQSETDPGAFIAGLKLEMDGARADYTRDLCRQVWGTSNGVIATCASDNNGNPTCVVTLAAATTKQQVYQCFADGGMTVDIGTVASPTLRVTAAPVVDYSVATPGAYTISITADGTAFAVAGTDFVFRSGNGGASDGTGNDNDGQKELTGLQTIVDDTATLHALTVANGAKQWQSGVYGNSGTARTPSEILLMNACMEQSAKSGINIDAVSCNSGVMMSLVGMLIASKRHTVPITAENSSLKLSAGASGIMLTVPGWGGADVAGLPCVGDRDAPGAAMYGLHFDSMDFYEHTAPEWADDDGSVLHWVGGTGAKDGYEAFLRSYIETGAHRRNSMFKITDLEELSA